MILLHRAALLIEVSGYYCYLLVMVQNENMVIDEIIKVFAIHNSVWIEASLDICFDNSEVKSVITIKFLANISVVEKLFRMLSYLNGNTPEPIPVIERHFKSVTLVLWLVVRELFWIVIQDDEGQQTCHSPAWHSYSKSGEFSFLIDDVSVELKS